MSGCVWEYTASFLSGGATSFITGMPTGSSNKYVTIYEGTWDTCNKVGDAVKETSTNGNSDNGSWNGDYARFVTSSYPVFVRGGFCSYGSNAGLFAFGNRNGSAGNNSGFRAVLVP